MSKLTINATMTFQDMGNATEADAATWAAYVEKRLREQYPEAAVSVRTDNRLSSGELSVQSEDELGDGLEVREFVQRLWERELDKAFDAPAAIVPLGMTATPLQHYVVDACRETGEWLREPQATGEEVRADEWSAKRDTDSEHYDTYEHGDPGASTQETRAITVRWAS